MEKKLQHKERPHAPFGGSVANRRINCTGSYFLETQVGKLESSKDADDGTKAHECCEYELRRFLYQKIHGEYPDDIGEPAFFEEFKEYAVNYRETVWKEGFNESITGKLYSIEEIVTIDESLGMFGPSDISIIAYDERGRLYGVVGDYKHGFDSVLADKNDQLAHYACGLREGVRRSGKDLEYVKAFIYQPRAGGDAYRPTLFTNKFLDTWKKRALKAATQIFVEKKPKFKVGSWCKHCAGKGICKSYIEVSTKNAALEIVDYKTIELPLVETLNDDQLKALVLHGNKIEDFIDAARKLAFKRCLNGDPIPGLKVVEGAGRRSWGKDVNFILDKFNEIGLPEDKLTKSKLIGITEVKKLLKGRNDLEDILDVVAPKKCPQILVPEEDSRPPISSNSAHFHELGE